MKNELDKDLLFDKAYRSDGLVEVDMNRILFEMNRTAMEERNLSYLDRLFYSRILYEGERLLPAGCFLINFNYYTYKGHDETIEIYTPRNKNGELLTYCKQIMNIYVPNILKKYYNGDSLNEIERWVLVMALTDVKEAKKIAESDEVLMELIEDSIKVKDNSKFIKDYDYEIEERDNYIEMGFERGIEQGEMNLIKKMMNNDVKLEDISKMTKIPLNKLKALLN